jgi:hypothetical protein
MSAQHLQTSTHHSIRRVITGLILTALIALALWLPFRPGASVARTVDPEPFPRQPSAVIWLPFRQSSPPVAIIWLPFRTQNPPSA